jgi:hypothetical protein
MTPKEKAQELIDKFYQTTPNEAWYNPPLGSLSMEYKAWDQAKECALIVVDEIISSREDDGTFNDNISYTGSEYYTPHPMYLTYWKQVKQEIEKL